MKIGPQTTFSLLNGVKIPILGLGTYKMEKENVETAIPAALDAEYRLFDTATVYKNEQFVGSTLIHELKKRNMQRGDIFVTSKLQTLDQGYEEATKAIVTSLTKLGMDYIDLYLIHWPGASGLDPSDPLNLERRKGSWKALEEALKDGKLRAIGVSNYMTSHLREMEGYAKIMPMVNQIELHPTYYPEDIVEYCQEKGIFIQAYSSLGRGKLLAPEFLERHPGIPEIVTRHDVKVGQVYLRWAWQHGFGILPKSNTPARVKENADIFGFALSKEEMHYLDEIHRSEPLKICWDPKTVA
jgi:diketogulonate reductase-like aldo/keto reductase